MALILVLAVFFTVALVIASVHAVFEDGRVRQTALAIAGHAPLPLLHSINPDRCIGCEGCVDACPTNVLALVHHKVQVLNYKDCVQCEQCVWACPTSAIVMHREGAQPQTISAAEIDANFQTTVPGQYLIGEVAGKPLVKNAANLGRLVVEHMLADGLRASSPTGEILDVAIVGSGPGGLSAGLTCIHHGLRCAILEKEQGIASTVSRYPKGKNFMSEPGNARNLSFLPVFDGSKEQLLAAWKQVIADVKLPIHQGEAVLSVERGLDGIFLVTTTVRSYRARRVILATGLRGKPRLLAVPGANLSKVHSVLENPGAYRGQNVLVVGGGDSALEAAMSLADGGAHVTLSYRSKAFTRAKVAHQGRILQYEASARIRVLLGSNPTRFDEETVTIQLANGVPETSPNQQAFLLIGAEAPIAWLEKLGVRFVQKPHLYQLGAVDKLVRALVPHAEDCSPLPAQAIAAIRGQQNSGGEFAASGPTVPAVHKSRAKRQRSVIEVISNEWTKVRTAVRDIVESAPPTAVERTRISPPPLPPTPAQTRGPQATRRSQTSISTRLQRMQTERDAPRTEFFDGETTVENALPVTGAILDTSAVRPLENHEDFPPLVESRPDRASHYKRPLAMVRS